MQSVDTRVPVLESGADGSLDELVSAPAEQAGDVDRPAEGAGALAGEKAGEELVERAVGRRRRAEESRHSDLLRT
jgi:hypothetical protein